MDIKFLVNLQKLKEKYLDFFEWSLKNYQFVSTSNVNEICSKYGVSISFIYSFLKKIKLSGMKEFIFHLSTLTKDLEKTDSSNNIFEKINSDLSKIVKLNDAINYDLMNSQMDKILQLVNDLKNYKSLYFFGFNYSKIAIMDLLEFLVYYNKKVHLLNSDNQFKGLKQSLLQNGLLIVFSMRALNPSFEVLLEEVKDLQMKKVIITANPDSKIAQMFDLQIQVSNIMKMKDPILSNLVLSPSISFNYFNAYLKSAILFSYLKTLRENIDFNIEVESWKNDSIARKIKQK